MIGIRWGRRFRRDARLHVYPGMALRGKPLFVTYTAYKMSDGSYVAGDAANHVLTLSRDGVSSTPANAPVFIAAGEYSLQLTAAETDCAALTLCGTSNTPGVLIVPVRIGFDVPAPVAFPQA
jgi:hypothetical protein